MVNPIKPNSYGFPQIDEPFVDTNRWITSTWLDLLRGLFTRTGGGAGIIGMTGEIRIWGGASDPDGWYICDHRQVAIASDPDLYAVIGDSNGAAASGFFRLPDCVGRTVVGSGGGYVRGQTGGSATATIAKANLPAYSLDVTDPGHTHPVSDPGHDHTAAAVDTQLLAGALPGSAIAGNTGSSTTGVTVDSAATGITVASGGSGTALPTISPYSVQNFIIKR